MAYAIRKSLRLSTIFMITALMVLGLMMPALAAQPDIKISAIEIQGNKSVSSMLLLPAIKTKAGDMIPQDKLESKIKDDLMSLYNTGLIADQTARFAPEKDGVKVIFEIVENPKITGIDFQGNTMVATNEILPQLKIKVGEVLNTRILQDDFDTLLKFYANKGGSIRIADVNTDKDNKLIIKVVEQKIEKIVITGNKKTKTSVIQRELASKEGQLIDFNKIRAEQRRIFNLGYFEELTPALDPGTTQDSVVYTITVKERNTGSAGGGLAYSPTDSLVGYIEATEKDLFGNGQSLNLRLEMGVKGTRDYEMGFLEPWMDNNRTSMGLNLYNKSAPRIATTDNLDYIEKRTGGEVTLGRPLDLDSTVSLKLRIENTDSIRDDDPVFSLTGDGATRSITLGYSRDTRDNFMDPRSGYQLGGSIELAGGPLGGDNRFNKYKAHASTYIKAFKYNTVALRVTGGYMACAPEERPEQELFRVGGQDSVRGYSYGTFIGDTMAYANLEFRFPLNKTVSGAAFLDTGNAWDKNAGLGADGLKTGGGIGIRVDTPLGLLRLDYGLSKRSDGGGFAGQTYFSIGQTF